MKKIGKYLLSLVLVFASVFVIAGCGKEKEKDDPTAISNEDWQKIFSTDMFRVRTLVNVTPDGPGYGNYEINYYKSDYEIIYKNIFPNEGEDRILNVSYLNNGAEKFTYKLNSTTSKYEWEHTLGVETEYDSNIRSVKDLIWYVKQRQDSFTKDDGSSSYRLTLAGNTANNYVSGLQRVLKAETFNIDTIVVAGNAMYLNSSSNETIIMITFDEVSAVDYWVSHEINSIVSSYTLVNNSNDVNQVTLEVTSTGFHVAAQNVEEYLKDNGDGTYAAYVKQGATFTKATVTKAYYEQEYKKYVTAHTFDFSTLSISDFNLVNNQYVTNQKIDLTDTGTKYEYHFSNIVIDLNARTLTWDYKVHDKSLNQDSPTYQIEVSILREEISYPTVE